MPKDVEARAGGGATFPSLEIPSLSFSNAGNSVHLSRAQDPEGRPTAVSECLVQLARLLRQPRTTGWNSLVKRHGLDYSFFGTLNAGLVVLSSLVFFPLRFTFRAAMEGRWQPGASVPCYVRADRHATVHEHRFSCNGGRRLQTFAVAERAGKVGASGGARLKNWRVVPKEPLYIEHRNHPTLKHSHKTCTSCPSAEQSGTSTSFAKSCTETLVRCVSACHRP